MAMLPAVSEETRAHEWALHREGQLAYIQGQDWDDCPYPVRAGGAWWYTGWYRERWRAVQACRGEFSDELAEESE